MIELQSNKKVATPYFHINLPFQVYPPFLAKSLTSPPLQVTQFLKGPTPFNEVGGGEEGVPTT